MSLGNLKKLQAAERLLKQGKAAEAFEQLERLARAAPSDVLTINRMGDLLARQGRTTEAIGYYFKIATFYTDGGYLPKAIAIYKKIVRLDPKSSISLSRLGELYLKQKLPAEAQRFLITAAQQYEESGDFTGAREAYEKLVKSDPENPLHRARLADAMAAGGDNQSALAELLNLGDKLPRCGKGRDAETTYRRALKLDPSSADAILGIARALSLQGNVDEAITCLESSLAERIEPQFLSELALVFERAGRPADTEKLLLRPGAQVIPDVSVGDLLALAVARGETGAFWDRLDRVTAGWVEQGHGDRVGELLERLSASEDHGRAPALERLERHLRQAGQAEASVRVLERLVQACRDADHHAEADAALKRLKAVAPTSRLFSVPAAASTGGAAPAGGFVPNEFEAPAVPIGRNDQEFVTGRLTQAEILEKYSLLDQAQQQVLEVTARFPGHVGAQQKLLSLRRSGDPSTVRDTLVSLALACRAGGDTSSADEAANEALQIGGMDPRTEEALRRLGLLGGLPAAATPPSAPRPQPEVAVSQEAGPADAQDSLLIDFDTEDTEDAEDDGSAFEPTSQAEQPVPGDRALEVSFDEVAASPSASGPVRAPGPDMLAEIRHHLQQGRAEDAQRGIMALESLGYGSAELDALAAAVERMLLRPESSPIETGEPDDALVLDLDEDDPDSALALSETDDLSTITAALEGDVAESEGPLTPDAGTEQSVEEVFAAFRQAVEDEVGEDARTHYDLAIGYKEMGLLDEAIDAFEVAAKSADLARDANMMLAVCHRERGDMPRSVEYYRRAAAIACEDPEIRVATHYDLADVLIQAGDEAAALDELRRVLELDPRYRDVRQRIGDLETRLQI